MDKGFEKRKSLFITILFISNILVLSAMLYSSFFNTTDMINRIINICCAVIMELVLIYGSNSLYKSYILRSDLLDGKSKLKQVKTDIEDEAFFPEIFFSTSILRERFNEYRCEFMRLDKKYPDTKKCDIKDYLNYDLIDLHIQKNITDLIPGILTALGIAGTFIGLMVGLNDFKINNVDIDQMQTNISLLLNGIKTAFLTSIFGIILSLIFNIAYRYCYYSAEKELDEFIISFEKIVPSVTNTVINEIASFNHNQLDMMEKFSETIADRISETLTPLFSGFGETAKELKDHIISTHDESLEKIVNTFVNNMNQSLGNQFDSLSHTLDTLNKTQLENANKIQSAIDRICESSDNISDINTILKSSVESLRGYTLQINSYQIFITKATKDLYDAVKNVSSSSESQSFLIESLVEEQKTNCENINKIKECIDLTIKISQEQLSSIEEIIKQNKDILEQQSASTEKYLNNVLEKAYSVIQNVEHTYNKKDAELATTANDLIQSCTTAMNEQISTTRNILDILSTESKETLCHINTVSEEHNQKLLDMYQSVIGKSEELLDTSIQQAKVLNDSLNDNVSVSIQNIKRLFTELDNNIERMLTNTFTTFDTSLTDIANTVSGTILNTRENIDKLNQTTENIPEIVYQIYDNMSKSITEHMDESLSKIFKDYSDASNALMSFNETSMLICSEMKKTAERLAEIENGITADRGV